MAQDGRADAVRLQASDRLCFEDQRLLRVNGANPGSDAAAQDAAYWAADSLVEAQGRSEVRAWALARSIDRSGNAIDYSYLENAATGEHLPSGIRWGANGSQPHHARIAFEYEDRPDKNEGYLAGSRIDRTLRLKTLRTWADTAADGSGGMAAQTVTLGYGVSPSSRRSLLQSVQACDGAGTCLPATRFDWGDLPAAQQGQFALLGRWAGPAVPRSPTYNHVIKDYPLDLSSLKSGDFNADGKLDLAVASGSSGQWTFHLSTGSGFRAVAGSAVRAEARDTFTGHIDGDGRTDLIGVRHGAPWDMCFARGDLSWQCQEWSGQHSDINSVVMPDINGDGRGDAVVLRDWRKPAPPSHCVFNGSTFDCRNGVNIVNTEPPPGDPDEAALAILNQVVDTHFGDQDGDGVVDVGLLRWVSERVLATDPPYKSRLTLEVCAVGDAGTCRSQWSYAMSDTEVKSAALQWGSQAGDVNGDGYADALAGTQTYFGDGSVTQRHLRVCRSTGTGVVCCAIDATGALDWASSLRAVGDFDGNGSTDLLLQVNNSGSAYAWKLCSLQNLQLECRDWTLPHSVVGLFELRQVMVADFLGLGRPQFAFYNAAESPAWSLYGVADPAGAASAVTRQDRLVRVTNGLQHVTEVDYAAAGDPDVYTPTATGPDGAAIAQTYPKQAQARAGVLVRSQRVGNGQGGWLETRYRYAGAALDLQGRGTLGFASISATDVGSGITRTQWLSQDWPYTGMPLAARTSAANGTRLGEQSHTLDRLALAQPNGRTTLFPYVRQSSETLRDLDGSDLSTRSVTRQYDDWGNLKQEDRAVNGGGAIFTAQTVTTYRNDSSNWLLGLPTRTRVGKTRDGTTITRTTDADYDTLGRPSSQTVEPGDLTYQLTTTLDRGGNPFGLVNRKTLNWRDPAGGIDKSRVVEETRPPPTRASTSR